VHRPLNPLGFAVGQLAVFQGTSDWRVGVCKELSNFVEASCHCSRVEKQSYFPRRRYAHTPTRRYASLRSGVVRPETFLLQFFFLNSTHDHKRLRARAAVQRRSRGSATLPRHTRWKASITSNAGRAGAQPWPTGFTVSRESSGLGSRSRSMTTIVALATARRFVCISGLRLSVKLRENAQSGGPGYCSLFSRQLLAPASI